jgi:hypothetical protein
MGLVHDKFCLVLYAIGKAHGWVTFSKCEAQLNYQTKLWKIMELFIMFRWFECTMNLLMMCLKSLNCLYMCFVWTNCLTTCDDKVSRMSSYFCKLKFHFLLINIINWNYLGNIVLIWIKVNWYNYGIKGGRIWYQCLRVVNKEMFNKFRGETL